MKPLTLVINPAKYVFCHGELYVFIVKFLKCRRFPQRHTPGPPSLQGSNLGHPWQDHFGTVASRGSHPSHHHAAAPPQQQARHQQPAHSKPTLVIPRAKVSHHRCRLLEMNTTEESFLGKVNDILGHVRGRRVILKLDIDPAATYYQDLGKLSTS
jgi:hypothetical protein